MPSYCPCIVRVEMQYPFGLPVRLQFLQSNYQTNTVCHLRENMPIEFVSRKFVKKKNFNRIQDSKCPHPKASQMYGCRTFNEGSSVKKILPIFFFTLNEENSRRRDKHCDGHFLNDKMFLAAYTSTIHRLRGVDVRAEFSRFGFVLQAKQNILANKKTFC